MGYVLVLATEENLRMGDCYAPFEEYEIKAAIPACDGVEEVVDPEQIRAALTELNTVYAAPIIEITAREYHGEKTFGVLDTRKLLEVLRFDFEEHVYVNYPALKGRA